MAATLPIRLRAELEFYERHKEEWLKSRRDQFVVIKGSDLLGFYADFHNAYLAGVGKFGMNTDFLVKRVVLHEPVFVVF
jgi:hypothetical protein